VLVVFWVVCQVCSFFGFGPRFFARLNFGCLSFVGFLLHAFCQDDEGKHYMYIHVESN